MVVMLQGFIVLFSGAMTYVVAEPLAWLIQRSSQAIGLGRRSAAARES
jgi:hypothetical protein